MGLDSPAIYVLVSDTVLHVWKWVL